MPEEHARTGLDDSLDRNRQQHLLVEESRVLLTGLLRAELSDELRIAVAEGIQAAMTDEAAQRFVRSVLSEAQQMATAKTGEVVGGAVWALMKRGALFMFLGSIVYAIGGWGALASLAKFFASGDR